MAERTTQNTEKEGRSNMTSITARLDDARRRNFGAESDKFNNDEIERDEKDVRPARESINARRCHTRVEKIAGHLISANAPSIDIVGDVSHASHNFTEKASHVRSHEPTFMQVGETINHDRTRKSTSRQGPAEQQFPSRTGIVTGAARGIGYETAFLLLSQNIVDTLIITDIDETAINTATESLRGQFSESSQKINGHNGQYHYRKKIAKNVIGLHGDVTERNFAAGRLLNLLKQHEINSVEVLVLNAGYTRDAVIHKMNENDWEAMLSVHLTANFRIVKALEDHIRGAAKREIVASQSASGQQHTHQVTQRSIIIVSSTVGIHGNAGQVNYSAAKAGVVGLVKSIAKEWGQFQIRCNAVAFGYIDTRLTRTPENVSIGDKSITLGIPGGISHNIIQNMIPLRRLGSAHEAAGAILLLVSPFASYITGQVLEVDGGVAM